MAFSPLWGALLLFMFSLLLLFTLDRFCCSVLGDLDTQQIWRFLPREPPPLRSCDFLWLLIQLAVSDLWGFLIAALVLGGYGLCGASYSERPLLSSPCCCSSGFSS
ncbi:hypothetical protein NL676_026292 [Syzygium grande]|nr:hypothetical protein NL676_026292 [Syzygium grande]